MEKFYITFYIASVDVLCVTFHIVPMDCYIYHILLAGRVRGQSEVGFFFTKSNQHQHSEFSARFFSEHEQHVLLLLQFN